MMNIEIFSKWLRRQGHDVIHTESSYWFNAGPRVYQAFPFGWIIQPSEAELRELMIKHNILALRYSTPLDYTQGVASYHVVLQKPYDLDCIGRKSRNNIKQGLSACQVEKISFGRLAKEGWKLQDDTIERQKRTDCMGQSEWEKICLSAEDLPGFTAWGAIVDGKLAASIITARIGDTWYVPYAQCLQEYMCQRVNHALFFTASCNMLADEGIKEIFFSLHSLDAPASVNGFKFRMGHTARPVRQRVVLHPILKPFVNQSSYKLVNLLHLRNPDSNFLSKTEGMLRFYILGKKPLYEQEWPDCLDKYKQSFSHPPEPAVLEQAKSTRVLTNAD